MEDLGWGWGTASGDGWETGGLDGHLGLGGLLDGSGWDVEDVQLSAGGLLDDVLLGRVVGDVVSIDDVVVPVSATLLESMGTLEAESSLP